MLFKFARDRWRERRTERRAAQQTFDLTGDDLVLAIREAWDPPVWTRPAPLLPTWQRPPATHVTCTRVS